MPFLLHSIHPFFTSSPLISRNFCPLLNPTHLAEKLKKFLQEFEINGELKYFNQLVRVPPCPDGVALGDSTANRPGARWLLASWDSHPRSSTSTRAVPELDGSIEARQTSCSPVLTVGGVQQRIANRAQRVVEVSLEDVEAHREEELAQFMRMNTRRYQSLLGDAIDAILPPPDDNVRRPARACLACLERASLRVMWSRWRRRTCWTCWCGSDLKCGKRRASSSRTRAPTSLPRSSVASQPPSSASPSIALY